MHDENAHHLKSAIIAEAKRLGFAAIGFAQADRDPLRARRLSQWLEAGHHGTMQWMEERADIRPSPRAMWEEARSVMVLGMSYAPDCDPLALEGEKDKARISVYARSRDYHLVVKKALKALARFMVDEAARLEGGDSQQQGNQPAQGNGSLQDNGPLQGNGPPSDNGSLHDNGPLHDNAPLRLKVFVDTAPVMEKPLGQLSGIGWQGKHSNLVNRDHGSWLFLGAIYTTQEFPADRAEQDHCGSCNACMIACPTDAFTGPYRLNAARCISYLTIEHKGPIPEEFREKMGNRIYGCDDCLAVCPWNKFADQAQRHQALIPREELAAPALADFLTLDDAGFRALFSGSPIKRIGRNRFIRNCLIAAGNAGISDQAARCEGNGEMPSPNAQFENQSKQGNIAQRLLPLVQNLLTDPDPVVAEAARWAEARLLRA